MKRAQCVLYESPKNGCPALAVVFASDWQVLAAREVRSHQSAEIIFAQLKREILAMGAYVFEQRDGDDAVA
jgi:hypothetical protein